MRLPVERIIVRMGEGRTSDLRRTLAIPLPPRHKLSMPTPNQPSREERLAAKLRENLRRRKAQARAQEGDAPPALPKALPKS